MEIYIYLISIKVELWPSCNFQKRLQVSHVSTCPLSEINFFGQDSRNWDKKNIHARRKQNRVINTSFIEKSSHTTIPMYKNVNSNNNFRKYEYKSTNITQGVRRTPKIQRSTIIKKSIPITQIKVQMKRELRRVR